MSILQIKDGRGTGNLAGVDSDGKLLTLSTTIPEVSTRTKTGDQYLIPVGKRSISTVDTEYSILRMNPNATKTRFHVQRITVSVLNAEPVLFKLYLGSDAPTANNVSFAPGNTNTLSSNVASMDCDVWNGAGTGMTVASKGTESFAGYFTRGIWDLPVDGGQIWGLDAAVLVTGECAAANSFTSVVTGWEEDF